MTKRKPISEDRQFALIAKALSDPNRLVILQRIGAANGQLACGEVRESMDIAPATLSHHMKELEHAGLIRIERDGRFAKLHLQRDVWQRYLKRLEELI